jgi:hypothetical protein
MTSLTNTSNKQGVTWIGQSVTKVPHRASFRQRLSTVMSEGFHCLNEGVALKWWSRRSVEAVLHHLIMLLAVWSSQDRLEFGSTSLDYALDTIPILCPPYCTSQKTPCLNYENFPRLRYVPHREVFLNLYRNLDNSVSNNYYRLL